MNCNGTDRDIALSLVDALNTTVTLLETINDTKYAPHITTQPTDFEGDLGDTATFSVVATNVKSYRWQFSSSGGQTWANTGTTGYTTDTINLVINEARLGYVYRCKIEGLDNSVIYTDIVKMIQTAEG